MFDTLLRSDLNYFFETKCASQLLKLEL